MSNSSNIGSSPIDLTKPDDIIRFASKYLDEKIYDDLYKSTENGIDPILKSHVTNMSKLASFKIINGRIETLKVSSFVLSILCTSMAIKNALNGNTLMTTIHLVIALDSFRISYNSYTKNYLAISIHSLTKNLSTLSSTLFKVATSAIGLSDEPDPIQVLLLILIYNILYYINTIIYTLLLYRYCSLVFIGKLYFIVLYSLLLTTRYVSQFIYNTIIVYSQSFYIVYAITIYHTLLYIQH